MKYFYLTFLILLIFLTGCTRKYYYQPIQFVYIHAEKGSEVNVDVSDTVEVTADVPKTVEATAEGSYRAPGSLNR